MELLPTWDHVKDRDLAAWLKTLPEDRQIYLKDKNEWMLDRARGDVMMAEFMAIAPPALPRPLGFEDWDDERQCDWYNEVMFPFYRERSAERRAIKEAVARGEFVA